jgi:hypothetical protein
MLGFFCCAAARGEAAMPKTTTSVTTKMILPTHFIEFLLLLSLS